MAGCFRPVPDVGDRQLPRHRRSALRAYHPQTLLAYSSNDKTLPVLNGEPLRLRVERLLGYKHAKYVMRLELVTDFADIGDGKGGYWEDQGYQW